MTTEINYIPELIAEKQALLDKTRKILKKEFVGIDQVIDQVIDSITAWFLFPELQERPLIINLWGMTGVGKTALVIRLSGLLQYDKKFFRFDMGNNSKEYTSLKENLRVIFRNQNGSPFMLAMDEFQYAKTKNEDDHEIDNHFSRIVWDLFDSGKFQSFRNADSDVEILTNLKNMLSLCLDEGVTVHNGCVRENESIFLEIISTVFDEDLGFDDPILSHLVIENENKSYSFLPKKITAELFKYFEKKSMSIIEFKKMLNVLDGPGTIDLIEKVIDYARSNKWVDCSKSLIFVLGNLDDAYKMSSSFNPDINADDFHEASKYININHIKRALKRRFKNEQIARLGNNHIIYPAFSQQTFIRLIKMELENISTTYLEKFGISLAFTDCFCKLLYTEGVYPTQGTRPLYSTIYHMVNTKIPMLLSENIVKALNADKVLFDFTEPNMKYSFYKKEEKLHDLEIPVLLNLENLRAAEKDDMQAITAVHESGHAIVSIAASKVLPEYICSTSADTDALGFVVLKKKWLYFSKEEGIKKIAEFFGGILAEEIIFGEEKVTRGSEQDIEEATELAAKMVKDYGMGKTLANIEQHGFSARHSYLDKNNESNAEVKSLLEQARALAKKILLQEKQLLLQLANYLSDERIIKKDAIAIKVKLYGSHNLNSIPFIEDGKHLFYRNHLKNQLQNISSASVVNISVDTEQISLNRTK